MTREEVNQRLDKLCEYGGMMLDWQYVEAIRIAAVFYETGKDTATKETSKVRKSCTNCKWVEKAYWGYNYTCHKRECQNYNLWEPTTKEGE